MSDLAQEPWRTAVAMFLQVPQCVLVIISIAQSDSRLSSCKSDRRTRGFGGTTLRGRICELPTAAPTLRDRKACIPFSKRNLLLALSGVCIT